MSGRRSVGKVFLILTGEVVGAGCAVMSSAFLCGGMNGRWP
jgi:hypothetical protein